MTYFSSPHHFSSKSLLLLFSVLRYGNGDYRGNGQNGGKWFDHHLTRGCSWELGNRKTHQLPHQPRCPLHGKGTGRQGAISNVSIFRPPALVTGLCQEQGLLGGVAGGGRWSWVTHRMNHRSSYKHRKRPRSFPPHSLDRFHHFCYPQPT